MKKKLELLMSAVIGNFFKIKVNYDLYVRGKVDVSSEVDSSLVVSLTSYAHRARHSVQYTLYSLLKQRVRPAHIVLWLDEKEFSKETLPPALKVLERNGVEVCFHKNLRSYKKLIPTLKRFPDKNVVTVDDDIYYSSNLVSEMLSLHRQYPDAIVAEACAIPLLSAEGKLQPYRLWPKHHVLPQNYVYDHRALFPVGYGGVLYPAGVFDEEVLNEEVFMRLCPIADDVWFYVTGIRLKRNKVMSLNSEVRYYQVDLLRQYLKKDRLTQSNRMEGQNDVQLRALLEHYHLTTDDFLA